MTSRFIRNIIILAISVGIIVTYLQPELSRIREKQQEVSQYREAVSRATNFNSQLRQLLQQVDSIPTANQQALEQFLPSEVDLVSVSRDVEQYARQSNLQVTDLSIVGDLSQESVQAVQRQVATGNVTEEMMAEQAAQDQFAESVVASQLEVSLVGSYDAFNEFLVRIERNRYPLQVINLQVEAGGEQPSEEATVEPPLSYSLTLQVYASPLTTLSE